VCCLHMHVCVVVVAAHFRINVSGQIKVSGDCVLCGVFRWVTVMVEGGEFESDVEMSYWLRASLCK
jgi:hypothetical protein